MYYTSVDILDLQSLPAFTRGSLSHSCLLPGIMSSSESEVAAPPAKAARRENLMGCQGANQQGILIELSVIILNWLGLKRAIQHDLTRCDTKMP